jgi:uncharacterized protein
MTATSPLDPSALRESPSQSMDMVYKLPAAELHDLKERIESRQGLRQLSYMREMEMGNDQYDLVALS